MENQGFKKKGGLFSEFANKNKVVLERKKLEHLNERLEKEKNLINLNKNNEKNIKMNEYSPIRFKSDSEYSGMSMMNRAKDIIDKQHLFKLKEVYDKTGVFK